MNERLNKMFPSFHVGRIFSTDVRISWWFMLVPLVLRNHGLEISLAFTVLLSLTVLLHEFAHVIFARASGGAADEIHLTPYGGLTPVRSAHRALSIGFTAAAGPLANLFLCICFCPVWYSSISFWTALNPFEIPVAQFNPDEFWRDACLLLFSANWTCLLVNLLPVTPLDCGQILRAVLSTRIHPELVHRATLQIGLVVAVTLLVAGAIFDRSQLVLIAAFVLMINIVQLLQEDVGEAIDDSGFSYDFTAAYESLESTNPTATRQSGQGILQRWRENRRLRREQQERVRRMEAEQQLDHLLAKVHETGLQSLSEDEQKRLRSCSELLRSRPKNEG